MKKNLNIKNMILTIILVFTGLFINNIFANSNNINNNIDKIVEKVEVDCIFSIGNNCRPAHYLRENNLRTNSAPLDWMMKYSLDTVIHLFETKFTDFFKNIKEIPTKNSVKNRTIIDTKNNITSIHYFEKSDSLKNEQIKFNKLMKQREDDMISLITKSNSIGLICARQYATSTDLINFINKFSKIYPNKKITLINIIDSNIKNLDKKIILNKNNLKIIQYKFHDQVPNKSWKGNSYYWNKIVKNIKLNTKTDQRVN